MATTLAQSLYQEVHATPSELHPQITQLLHMFVKYLKEPRYQAPLTLEEISRLFEYFYSDLNSLVVNLYTQSNSTKKRLIASSLHFQQHPKRFDYLLAISNYSASTVKLTKRTDQAAMAQLRVFNYYKFATVFETIERAQTKLFSMANGEDDISLYEKIFRFEQRDIIFQEFFDEKVTAIKALQLGIECFIEDKKVSEYFQDSSSKPLDLIEYFQQLSDAITPFAKLKLIVQIQKSLIHQLAVSCFNGDHSLVNNDVLLPSLIYYIVYHLPSQQQYEVYLNFTFVKNFLNLIPNEIDLNTLTPATFLSSYTPTDKSQKRSTRGKKNFFDCLNLNEDDDSTPINEPSVASESSESLSRSEDQLDDYFFPNDKAVIHYIQKEFLNNGELTYYLTNFEAVLFFLSNVTLKELNPSLTTKNELLLQPLIKLVDVELLQHFKFPKGEIEDSPQPENVGSDKIDVNVEPLAPPPHPETNGSNRSRSGSLFNTISNKINDATHSVNRSRSNSSILNSIKSTTSLQKELFPSISHTGTGGVGGAMGNGSGGETVDSGLSATSSAPLDANLLENGNSMMKSILGRFGQVSVPQFTTNAKSIEDTNPVTLTTTPVVGDTTFTATDENGKKLNSKESPVHSRTRSSSFDNHQKRSSITSKFTTGVSELMTKLNNTNTNTSSLSLHSLTEQTLGDGLQQNNHTISISPSKRPDYNRSRTTSLQIMDKWFSNISTLGTVPSSNGNLLGTTIESSETPTTLEEITKFQNIEFEALTISDLKVMKQNYDKLCSMIVPHNDQSSHSEETSM
ncbi:hypothetical protein CAAN1_02S08988 [[Candida] anglica]